MTVLACRPIVVKKTHIAPVFMHPFVKFLTVLAVENAGGAPMMQIAPGVQKVTTVSNTQVTIQEIVLLTQALVGQVHNANQLNVANTKDN